MSKNLSESEALTYARKTYSGELEDSVVERVKTQYAERNQVKAKVEADAADTAWQTFAQTGNLNAIPTSVLVQMDGRSREALQQIADAKAKGTNIVTDYDVYHDLMQTAISQPERFAGMDLRPFYPNLSNADRNTLRKLQLDPARTQTFGQQANVVLDQLKISNSTKDKERKGLFLKLANDKYQQAVKAKGRELTDAESQAVLDGLTIEGSVSGGSWFGLANSKEPYYLVAGTPEEKKFTATIPPEDRAAITAALQKRGQPVTEAAIIRLYTMGQKK